MKYKNEIYFIFYLCIEEYPRNTDKNLTMI